MKADPPSFVGNHKEMWEETITNTLKERKNPFETFQFWNVFIFEVSEENVFESEIICM